MKKKHYLSVKKPINKYESRWLRCIDVEELAEFMNKYLKEIRGVDMFWGHSIKLAYRILSDKRWAKQERGK